jgi:hypothetical protein
MLASLILSAATYEASRFSAGKRIDIREVISLAGSSGWTDKETADRIVHAVSMINTMSDRETYKAAKGVGERLYITFTSKTAPNFNNPLGL